MLNFIESYKKSLRSDEKEFYNYIKGKNVVIVGPSPWMNGKNLGKKIDDHPIVIRVNQGIFLPSSNKDDYGSRTDVIYTSQRARDQYGMNFPQEFFDVKFNAILVQRKHSDFPDIKCDVCNNLLKEDDEYCLNEDWRDNQIKTIGHTQCKRPNLDYSKLNMKIVKRDVAQYNQYYRSSLLSGMLALIDMLCFEAKSINILGFDFYDGVKKMLENKDESISGSGIYCTGYRVFEDTMKLSHKDEDGKQLYLLKLIMSKHKNIEIDENLQRIMKERFQKAGENFSKYNLEYKNFIENKKIAIVGPASYLEGKNMGTEIDSHDIVIRLNLGQSLTVNKEDYGEKTDVIYMNQFLKKELGLELSSFVTDKVKFLCFQSFYLKDMPCNFCGQKIDSGEVYIDRHSYIITQQGASYRYAYHWNCSVYTDYNVSSIKIVNIESTPLLKFIGELPSILSCAVYNLLALNPSSISIYGCDFYDNIKGKKELKITDIYSSKHKTMEPLNQFHKDLNLLQSNGFKKLYKKYQNKITLDEIMKKIIEK